MELLQETIQLIREFNRILKLTWFYSPEHPAVKETLQKIAAQLHDVVPAEGYLLFNISGDNLFLGAIPLQTKDENVRGFVRQLRKRHVSSLLFYPEVSLQELEEFVKVLALDPKTLRKQGGIKPALASREITHIDVTEYQYLPDSSDVSEGDDTSFALLEATPERVARIIQYLQGKIMELDTIESQLLSEMMQNPMRIAQLQAQAAQSMVLPESSTAVNQLGEIMRNVMTRVWGYLNHLPEEESTQLKRKLALSLLHQDPTVALYIIATGKEAPLDHIESVKKALEHLQDSELINLIAASESDQQMDLEKISSLFFQLPINSQRSEALMSKFTDLLVKRRQNEDDEAQFTALQQELNQYPAGQMLTHAVIILLEMLEKEINTESEIDILMALQKGTNQLIELHQFGLLYDIYRTVYRLGQADKSLASIGQDIPATGDESAGQKPHEFYTWLTDIQTINRLIAALESTDRPGLDIPETGLEIGYEQQREMPISDQQKTIVELLAFIGSPAIPAIVDKINKIGYGNPIYQILQNLLVRFGDASIPFLEESLPGDSEQTQARILSIIGRIGTPKARTALLDIAPKLSPKLRQHMVNLLSQFSDSQSLKWLMELLRNEKNLELRLTALDGISKNRTGEATHFLITYASNKPALWNKEKRILQLRAIQLLGKQKIAEAVPQLIKLFQMNSWFFAGKIDGIRIAAVQALAYIGSAEVNEIIRTGCQDKRASVRSVCQSLVK